MLNYGHSFPESQFMQTPTEPGSIYRFGNFEVDTRSGELRRSGVRIKVQDQPFRILIKLLERAGEVVTRDDLRSALWSADTFVDFDTVLNTAVKRLREVLGESADQPIFIETIPRRGYRFVAPVNGGSEAVATAPERSKRPSAWWFAAAIASLLVAGAIGAFLVWVRSPALLPRITSITQITSDGLSKNGLVTDGDRIYFNEISSDHYVVAQVSSAGGSTSILDSSTPGWLTVSVTPDGSELLVVSYKPVAGSSLSIMPLPAGSIRPLGVPATDGRWGPDGKLYFVRDKEILVAGHDGENPRKLVAVQGYAGLSSFSRDGKRLTFSVYDDMNDTGTIWVVNTDGSDLHQPLQGWSEPSRVCCGSWSADEKFFLFSRFKDGEWRLWALPENPGFWRRRTREPVQLTAGPLNFLDPILSKDGRKLFAIGSHPKAELVRYDAKANELVPFLGGLSAGDVEFSHDGKSVVYVRYPEATLWRCKTDGTEAFQLTYPPMRVSLAHWSPDDKQIAFSGIKDGDHWTVYQIPAAGGSLEQLSAGHTNEQDPTWSSDGKRLAFGQFQPPGSSSITLIQLLDLSTRHISQVPESNDICCPRWSPDGTSLAAISIDSTRLVIFDFSTQKWRDLTKVAGQLGYFNWSRDGKYVYYDTLMVTEPEFGRIRVADGRRERILGLKDVRRFWGNWGPWTGITPENEPLLVRDISNQEIYALQWEVP